MKRILQTSQFKRDIKKAKKRGKDIEKLKRIVSCLVQGIPLDQKYKDHPLIGQWSKSRDCHIEPDWILIYTPRNEEIILERIGSHSDLFF